MTLFVFVWTASPSHAQHRRRKQPPLPKVHTIKPILVCRLATGWGYGKVQRFSAEFYQPGKLVYRGYQHAPKQGRYGYVLPDILVKNLLVDAKKAKLSTLPPNPIGPPDAPTDTLYLLIDGKPKTYTYCVINAPEVLVKYVQSIRDNITAILEEQEPAETPADSARLK